MSRKANPAVVGVFVIAATALLTAAVIIFGKGEIFKETREWVLYFDGSIKGLSSGSAVVFQGVRIGEVKDIRVQIDRDGDIRTPVIMQLDASLIDFEDKDFNSKEALENTRKMIDRGLRAQLQTQSLITGQLLIQLGFHPDKEAVYRSPGGPLPEMPTVPSAVQELSKTLEELPLKEIINNINDITINLDKLLRSGAITDSLANINDTVLKAKAVLDKIEQEIQPLSADARKVLHSVDRLIGDNSDKVGALLTDLEKTSSATRDGIGKITTDLGEITKSTEVQISEFLENATSLSEYAENMLSDQSDFRIEMNRTLTELQAALRSIRMLTEYLEQHPEALLKGKKE